MYWSALWNYMYSTVIYILLNAQGPVPTLFSEDPFSTMENMKKALQSYTGISQSSTR